MYCRIIISRSLSSHFQPVCSWGMKILYISEYLKKKSWLNVNSNYGKNNHEIRNFLGPENDPLGVPGLIPNGEYGSKNLFYLLTLIQMAYLPKI